MGVALPFGDPAQGPVTRMCMHEPMMAALVLASCLGMACGAEASPDTNGGDTDGTDDGSVTDTTAATYGPTTSTTADETTGDATESAGEPDPAACTSPTASLAQVGYHVDSATWPTSDGGQVESGRCVVDERGMPEGAYPRVAFRMTCTEVREGGTHQVFFVVDQASVGGRLDHVVGTEVLLEFQTQNWYTEHLRHEVATLRDLDGNLLFAGAFHTALSPSNPENEPLSYEGVVAGIPLYDTMPSEWPSPFSGFVIRDGLCAEGPADRPGAEFETRFGVEFETDSDPIILLDRSEADFVRDGVTYHAMVGDAFHRREFNCGDCMSIELRFIVVADEG